MWTVRRQSYDGQSQSRLVGEPSAAPRPGRVVSLLRLPFTLRDAPLSRRRRRQSGALADRSRRSAHRWKHRSRPLYSHRRSDSRPADLRRFRDPVASAVPSSIDDYRYRLLPLTGQPTIFLNKGVRGIYALPEQRRRGVPRSSAVRIDR